MQMNKNPIEKGISSPYDYKSSKSNQNGKIPYGSTVKWIVAVLFIFLGILTDTKLPLYKVTLGKMTF
ncbi:MAG: hypothetical protein ABF874_02270 [Liquorilactobacillus nagelii]|uniref:hypothetical protein n=2 Tax=Liquorilactobacillus nagelii TaxID=82688 RepID=UPI0039EBF88A